jgi:IMP dehydrogenase
MAIALAKAGGIGVIHRNLTPKDQAAEVVRVKLHLNGRIMRPIYVFGDDTMEAIENRRREKNYSFRSFPVTDRSGKLIGLLTENDFVFCDNPKLTASAVMTKDVMTAPPETDLSTAYEKMRSHKKKVLLLVDGKGFIAGMYVFSDVKRIKTGNSAVFNTDSNGQLRVAAAIGTGDAELKRAEKLVRCGVDVLVIDTAHADTASVIEGTLKVLKQKITRTDIVVGNISRGSSARNLVDAGADGIKVGQGPGSICTTRIIAGIGCPQVTAIYNCAKAIEGSGVPVCADGGISHSGDIVVAVVAGAQTVMLGRLLAGTDEAPGNIVNIHGVPHKIYRGMGSLGAMQDNDASRKRYGERSTGKDQIVPEGIEGAVPYQGGVDKLLHQYVEGLQRGMGYVGAATIQELQEKGEFFRISPSGLAESHPHNVEYIQDAPNYKLTRKG